MSNICTSEISSFLVDNIEWLFPLFVTILLTVISLRNEQRQKQLAEYLDMQPLNLSIGFVKPAY